MYDETQTEASSEADSCAGVGQCLRCNQERLPEANVDCQK